MKAHRISPFCIVLLVVPFSKITSFPVWFWLVQVRIYSTTIAADKRKVCAMQNHLYRMAVASTTMGYYNAPQIGYK